jgi:hypothetical protein
MHDSMLYKLNEEFELDLDLELDMEIDFDLMDTGIDLACKASIGGF